MDFYQPQLLLVNHESNFELLSTTFCPKFNIVVDNTQEAISIVTEGGLVKVQVKARMIQKFSNLPDKFKCINPIVHRVDLSSYLNFSSSSFDDEIQEEIEVSFFIADENGDNARFGGRSKIKTVSAGGELKPGKS